MKHLLILTSILLLSSPVIGQETGVLYLWKTSSGLQWKTFGNEKAQSKYEGEIKNMKPHGYGLMYFLKGKKVMGEWKNGKQWETKHYFYLNGPLVGKYVNGKNVWRTGVLFSRDRINWTENPEVGAKNYTKYGGEIRINGKPSETSTHSPHFNTSSFFSCDWSGNWCLISI